MKISSITTKSGDVVKFGNNVSVLAGANNSGKSQTLRDIQSIMAQGPNAKALIIDEIFIEKPEKICELFEGLEVTDTVNQPGYKSIKGLGTNLNSAEGVQLHYDTLSHNFQVNDNLSFLNGTVNKLKVSLLDASSRLNIVSTTGSYNPAEQQPQNILQSLYSEKKLEDSLRNAFKEAFEMDILLDYSGLQSFNLKVSEKFPEIPSDPRDAYQILKGFRNLDSEGDGFRSFAGIILSILLSRGRVILLDEPEAFLHPAQARYLGKWIGDNSDSINGQLIISTHSSNFLSGILSSDKNVEIFRLNRIKNQTSFNLISSEATLKLAKSPMLSSQRVLEAIFHHGVVVCEADADRIVYQTVATKSFNKQEILFIHSHNKQTLKNVVDLLKEAKIPVAAIADIDVLNDIEIFSQLYGSLAEKTIDQRLKNIQKEIADVVNNSPDDTVLTKLQDNLAEVLEQLQKGEHSFDGAKGAMNRIRKEISKWQTPKNSGIDGFPEEVKGIVSSLIDEVKDVGFFIVPVGELEGWINFESNRKNKWIISALEEIFDNNPGDKLKSFITEIFTYFKNITQ